MAPPESESKTLAKIIAMVRREDLLKEEDVADIIAEAERTGDYKALFRAYIRRRNKAAGEAEAARLLAMTEAEVAAEKERLRQRALDKARRHRAKGEHDYARWMEAMASIVDFDPKQGGQYVNRMQYFLNFDPDEESPLGPMRFTDQVYQEEGGSGDYKPKLCEALNIISVKIASSDVGFPIHIYGTVIARDSVDHKCLYLFNCDKEHSQLINSEDESLVLTGPKRGLVLFKDGFVEIDLKIKNHQRHDRELSKGTLEIWGTQNRSLEECTVESKSLATRLSTMDVRYAFVVRAVEATIAIEVAKGDYYGEITASTTSIRKSLLLYDSKLAGTMTGDDKRVIQLMRPVVCVSLTDMLYIAFQTVDGKYERVIWFTPRVNGGDEDVISVGRTKMRVKVTWSTMDF